MFRVPDPNNQRALVEAYRVMEREHVKVCVPGPPSPHFQNLTLTISFQNGEPYILAYVNINPF
jgi:hypothetical protein